MKKLNYEDGYVYYLLYEIGSNVINRDSWYASFSGDRLYRTLYNNHIRDGKMDSILNDEILDNIKGTKYEKISNDMYSSDEYIEINSDNMYKYAFDIISIIGKNKCDKFNRLVFLIITSVPFDEVHDITDDNIFIELINRSMNIYDGTIEVDLEAKYDWMNDYTNYVINEYHSNISNKSTYYNDERDMSYNYSKMLKYIREYVFNKEI